MWVRVRVRVRAKVRVRVRARARARARARLRVRLRVRAVDRCHRCEALELLEEVVQAVAQAEQVPRIRAVLRVIHHKAVQRPRVRIGRVVTLLPFVGVDKRVVEVEDDVQAAALLVGRDGRDGARRT